MLNLFFLWPLARFHWNCSKCFQVVFIWFLFVVTSHWLDVFLQPVTTAFFQVRSLFCVNMLIVGELKTCVFWWVNRNATSCVAALLPPLSPFYWMCWHAGKSAKKLLWFISSGLSDSPSGEKECRVWCVKEDPLRLTDVNGTQPAITVRTATGFSVTNAHIKVWC